MRTKALAAGTCHTLPADMRSVIAADEKIAAIWQDLTPLARNEWICWTITVAKPETRAKHLAVMRDKMLKGTRRPCCWIGCTHRTDKAVSPSVQWLLGKRKAQS